MLFATNSFTLVIHQLIYQYYIGIISLALWQLHPSASSLLSLNGIFKIINVILQYPRLLHKYKAFSVNHSALRTIQYIQLIDNNASCVWSLTWQFSTPQLVWICKAKNFTNTFLLQKKIKTFIIERVTRKNYLIKKSLFMSLLNKRCVVINDWSGNFLLNQYTGKSYVMLYETNDLKKKWYKNV